MSDVRATFLETARLAADVIARPEVGSHWDDASALAEFAVRGLAGHLARAVGSVDAYLDRDEPPADEKAITPERYYAAAVGPSSAVDLSSPLHAAIRQRGEDAAANGWAALAGSYREQVEGMAERLRAEPPSRRVRVYGDMVLLLDDYLVTRLIELLVHIDDLCVSVGADTPALPAEAVDMAVAALVGVARRRHGDLAVVRALTRRERAAPETLTVL